MCSTNPGFLTSPMVYKTGAGHGEQRTLFDIVSHTAASLAGVFAGEREEMVLPEI